MEEATYIPGDEYREYVRQRSLNRALNRLVPWSGIWMICGVLVLVLGMLLRSEPEVIGVDPAGRGWKLKIVDEKGHEIRKGKSGE